jgi:hypothetical protein
MKILINLNSLFVSMEVCIKLALHLVLMFSINKLRAQRNWSKKKSLIKCLFLNYLLRKKNKDKKEEKDIK